ncbi:MAG: sulfatase [Verrucomicrobia bacterium]|nr:sulfatase [Verrucomicrobiota bacterium]
MPTSSDAPIRRDIFCLLAAALAACAGPCLGGAQSGQRPNILFIHADDLGWSDVGCYGASHYSTPAIDALAREGLRFTQAYAGSAICTPSRAGLITGLHAARLHTTGQPGYKTEDTAGRKFAHPNFLTTFPTNTPSIARTLTAAGYRTAILGKWGFDDSPKDHGFAEVINGPDEALVDAALDLLAKKHSRPFFVYVNYSRPHVPLHPDPARVAAYAARPEFGRGGRNPAYAAEVEALDRETGRLLAGLERHGLARNTVVIFGSDNGGFLGYDNERLADNSPLREGKASLYEGGIRVPLIIRWSGTIKPGTTTDVPVHWVDWHATLADLAGVKPVLLPALDGRSFAAVLRGDGSISPHPLYWHYPHYRRSMAGLSASPSSAVRNGDWKLLHFYEDDHVELYNLRDDIGELNNLALPKPDKTAAMLRQLNTWRETIGAQPPSPNRPN